MFIVVKGQIWLPHNPFYVNGIPLCYWNVIALSYANRIPFNCYITRIYYCTRILLHYKNSFTFCKQNCYITGVLLHCGNKITLCGITRIVAILTELW